MLAVAYSDGIEDVEDAQAVLQLPLFLVSHGAEHHLAEVFHVHDTAEDDDQGLDAAEILPQATRGGNKRGGKSLSNQRAYRAWRGADFGDRSV